MDLEALRESPVGQLVSINGTDDQLRTYDYFAFLPHPLPTVPDLDPESWSAVAAATAALGKLHHAVSQLPNPRLLIAPALAREAVDTSALEGTYGALHDVLEARLINTRPASPAIAEIHAYETMANEAFEYVKDRPTSVPLFEHLQGDLSGGIARST